MQKKPTFQRQNAHRKKRVKNKGWRRPRGIYSHQRDNYKYMGARPKPGRSTAKTTKGKHPSGYEETLINNPQELKKINPKTQAARISAKVGKKKKQEIIKKAEELKIKVLNK